MQKLILFRQEIESLNDEELNQCITSFAKIDRNKIESLLFKGLFDELIFNEMDSLNKMNGIISKIKQCRKPKTINNNNNNNNNDDDSVQISIKLNELPNVMISEISSFLQFSDQLQFEQANRAIFIGSRSSTKPIHSLNAEYCMKLFDFYHYRGDRKTYLHKLRAFNSVTFKIDYYTHYDGYIDYGFDNLFANIQQLTIHLPDRRGSGDSRVKAFNLILSPLSKRFDLSNIKALRLVNHFYYGWNPTDNPIENGLISMMTRNSKLEYFECYAIAFKNDNYDFLRTVKGFAAHSIKYSVMANMCLSIGDLQSLHIDAYQADAIIPYISNYNLKELCLGWGQGAPDREKWRKYGFKIFEQNMKCLERVYFDMQRIGDLIDMEILSKWINKTMKTLKYICFDVTSSGYAVSDILDALIKSLENVKKHRLKLQFIGFEKFDSIVSLTNYAGFIYIKLQKLISILSRNCDHWMIICYDADPDFLEPPLIDNAAQPRGVKFYEFVELMDKEYGITYTERSPQRTMGFAFTNKGCIMNGYHANWLMECDVCRYQKTIFYDNVTKKDPFAV